MIRKMLVGATVAAVVGLSATPPVAHAGGGMGTNSGLTTCRLVLKGAPKQDQIAQIQDFFLSSDTQDVVKIGTLSLLCDLPATGQTLNPAPGTNGTGTPVETPNSVACYSVGSAEKANLPVTVQDAFTRTFDEAGTYAVSLGAIHFVCVPALLAP